MQLANFSKQTNFDDSYFRFVPVSKMRSIFLRSLCPVGRQAGWLKKACENQKKNQLMTKNFRVQSKLSVAFSDRLLLLPNPNKRINFSDSYFSV
jgi:hypothetical protein